VPGCLGQVESIRVDPRHAPGPYGLSSEDGCIELNCVRVIGVHMRDNAWFCLGERLGSVLRQKRLVGVKPDNMAKAAHQMAR
jgi:hypothetical protein